MVVKLREHVKLSYASDIFKMGDVGVVRYFLFTSNTHGIHSSAIRSTFFVVP